MALDDSEAEAADVSAEAAAAALPLPPTLCCVGSPYSNEEERPGVELCVTPGTAEFDSAQCMA